MLVAGVVLAMAPGPAYAEESPTANEAPGFARERGISLAEAERRLGWQLVAPDLAERLEAALPETFGAVWIDDRDGDRVKVGIAPAVDSASADLVRRTAEAVGLPEYDIVPVPRTLAKLTADMEWLGREIERVNRGAATKLRGGVRTDLNAVQLTLPRDALSPAQNDLVLNAQHLLAGGLVINSKTNGTWSQYACAYPYCDQPLRGGVKINYSGGGSCSSAFTAQSKVDSALYLITAGHCLQNKYSTWSTKFADLSVHHLGPVWHWENNSQADMGIIRLTNPTGWSPKGWVQVTWSFDTTADDTYHISADKYSVLGMRICTTGSYWGMSDCGKVEELDVSIDWGDFTTHHLGLSSVCAKKGDSGAPMYALHNAYGIMIGGPDDASCETVYQGIKATETKLNVNVLHAWS